MAGSAGKGRGWHGDPAGHSKAGKKSPTKFKPGSKQASLAGEKGGMAAQRRGSAHKLTREERSRGGRNSRGKSKNRV